MKLKYCVYVCHRDSDRSFKVYFDGEWDAQVCYDSHLHIAKDYGTFDRVAMEAFEVEDEEDR